MTKQYDVQASAKEQLKKERKIGKFMIEWFEQRTFDPKEALSGDEFYRLCEMVLNGDILFEEARSLSDGKVREMIISVICGHSADEQDK